MGVGGPSLAPGALRAEIVLAIPAFSKQERRAELALVQTIFPSIHVAACRGAPDGIVEVS